MEWKILVLPRNFNMVMNFLVFGLGIDVAIKADSKNKDICCVTFSASEEDYWRAVRYNM